MRPRLIWLAIAMGVGVGVGGACRNSDGTGPPGPTQPNLVATIPIQPNYGIHDTFVRDGLAFVCAWNSGLLIYDVGNGIKGGSPSSPSLVSSLVTKGGAVHNAWWFHNPATSEQKYVFVGQEGPGVIGSSSSGDIHVVDVSDLTKPVEVGFYHLDGAGTHNFWVDEAAQILYAAYYNAGVVAIDVSGALPDSLVKREIGRIQPGGPGNTYVWGVQLHNDALYAIDMLTGLWQLRVQGAAFTVDGGDNVLDRYSSDLWLAGGYAYTGTWGGIPRGGVSGNALKIWRLDAAGRPLPQDSIVTSGIATVSDVEVSPAGKLLMFSAEGGPSQGLHFYSLADPARPTLVGRYLVAGGSSGIHTATFATIGGRLYAFAAKNPAEPALLILDVTDLEQ